MHSRLVNAWTGLAAALVNAMALVAVRARAAAERRSLFIVVSFLGLWRPLYWLPDAHLSRGYRLGFVSRCQSLAFWCHRGLTFVNSADGRRSRSGRRRHAPRRASRRTVHSPARLRFRLNVFCARWTISLPLGHG